MSDKPRFTRETSQSTDRGSLFRCLHRASQANSAAGDEAAVCQAMMRFAASTDVDGACLLHFAQPVNGRHSILEIRASWRKDNGPELPQGTQLSLADYPLLNFMRVDSTVVCENVASDQRLNDATRRLMSLLGLASFAIIPVVGGRCPSTAVVSSLKCRPSEKWLGAAIIGRYAPSAFEDTLIYAWQTLTSQAAATIEYVRLIEPVRRHRMLLQAVSEISKAASEILPPEALIQQVVDVIRERLDLYYVGLFLVDESGKWTGEPNRWAVLRAGTGALGRTQIEQAHKLEIGNESMIGWCAANGKARVSQDVNQETARFVNPALPETRSEMALPLISRGQVIGAMTIQSTAVAAFNEDDISILQTMADQLANAIQNARLFEERGRRTEELAALNYVATAVNRSLEMQDMLDAVLTAFITVTDHDAGLISLSDEETGQLYVASHQGLPADMVARLEQEGLQRTLCDVVYQTGETLALGDVCQDSPVEITGLVEYGFLAYIGVPLVFQDKRLGALCVFSGSVRDVGVAQLSLLEAIGRQVGIGIENARLFDKVQAALFETEEQARRLALLNEMSKELSLAEDLESVFHITAGKAGQILPSDHVTVMMLNSECESFTVRTLHGEPGTISTGSQRPLAGSWIELAVRENRLVSTPDARIDSLRSIRSLMVAPLFVSGQVKGTLNVGSRRPNAYSPRDENLMLQVASLLSSAIEHKRLLAQTQEQLADLSITQDTMSSLIAALSFDDACAILLRQAANAVRADRVSMFLIDGEHMTRIGTFPVRDGDAELIDKTYALTEYPLTKQVVKARQALALLADDPSLQEHARQAFEASGVVANATIPLVGREGVLGTLAVSSHQPGRAFSDHEIRLLQTLADQATVAIERLRLLEETQRRAEELAMLFAASRELASALLRAEEIAEIVVLQLIEIGELGCSLLVLDPDGDTLRVIADLCLEEDGSIRVEKTGEMFRLSDYPATARAIETLRPFVVQAGDLAADPVELAYMQEQRITTLAIIPLSVKGEAIGVMRLASWEEYHYTAEQLNLINTLANQAGAALENRRLLEQTQVALTKTEILARELAVLNELSQTLAARLSVNQVLNEACRGVSRLLSAPDVFVGLYDTDREEIIFASDVSEQGIERRIIVTPADNGLCDYIARSGTTLLLRENVRESLASLGIDSAGEVPLSWVGAPLRLGDRALGVIGAQSFAIEDAFDEHDRELLTAIASQTAIAIQNARLFEEIQNLAHREQALRKIVATINACEDLLTELDVIADAVCEFSPTDALALSSYVPNEAEITHYVATRQAQADLSAPRTARLPIKGSSVEWVIKHKRPLLEADIHRGQRFVEDERLNVDAIASRLIVPLQIGEEVIGTLHLGSQKPDAFTPEHVAFLSQVADQIALALERARLLEATRQALAEVRATHQRYLRQEWESALTADPDRDWGYVDGPSGLVADSKAWTSEMEGAVSTGELAIVKEPTNRDQPAKRTGLAMPIRLHGQTIGVLDFCGDDQVWTEDDKALVEALADQVALAIENQRLFEQTQASLAETQALFQTSRALAAAQETDDVWQAIIDGARQRHADACGLFVLDTEHPEAAQELILVTAWDKKLPARLRNGTRLSPGHYGLCDGLKKGQPLAIPDMAHTDSIDESTTNLLRSLGFTAGLFQPIAVRGRWFGLLIILYQAEHIFTKAETDFYRTLADQAALAFESQQLLLETQHRAERERLIRHITDKVRATTNLETILQTTVEELSKALGLPRAFVRLGTADELTPSALAHGTGNGDDLKGKRSEEEL